MNGHTAVELTKSSNVRLSTTRRDSGPSGVEVTVIFTFTVIHRIEHTFYTDLCSPEYIGTQVGCQLTQLLSRTSAPDCNTIIPAELR